MAARVAAVVVDVCLWFLKHCCCFIFGGNKIQGPFLGTTKETKTPFWHLLDPRLSGLKWPKLA